MGIWDLKGQNKKKDHPEDWALYTSAPDSQLQLCYFPSMPCVWWKAIASWGSVVKEVEARSEGKESRQS